MANGERSAHYTLLLFVADVKHNRQAIDNMGFSALSIPDLRKISISRVRFFKRSGKEQDSIS